MNENTESQIIENFTEIVDKTVVRLSLIHI